MNKNEKIGEIFIALGTGLFVVAALSSVIGSEEHAIAIAVLALIFIIMGLSMRRK